MCVLACMLMHTPMYICLHVVDDFAKETKMRKLLCGLKINQNLLLACRRELLEFLISKVPGTGGES